MAYVQPKDLDGFLPHLGKPDIRYRQQVGVDLLAYLTDQTNPLVCQDIGQLIDGLNPWMQSSNYKISSNGIEIMTYLIDRLGPDFRPYLQTVLQNVIDRLGDAKDTVREKSQLLLLKLLERNVLTPQILLEKLSPGFNHKNAKIREEVLRCLINVLNEHGTQSLTLNKFIPDIVKLLSDPTSTVRDTAFNTLVDLYKHVGDKLRVDLQKKNIVPQAKWPLLTAQFDGAKNSGELLPSARYCDVDEVDRIVAKVIPMRKPMLGSAVKSRSVASANSANSAGAVDEDSFGQAFQAVPTISQFFSARDITEEMKKIQVTISDQSSDWNKRVDALKKIRSLLVHHNAHHFDEFFVALKNLEIPLQGTLKDLRSQVVREACITVAFLAQELNNKFDKTAELLLQPLINLIQNSAKIMATSGQVAMRFIIQSTHSPRLIPVITSNAMTSKSKDIRRNCCEFLEIILTQWPTHPLEKHVGLLQEAVKKGIADADPEARVSSRRAFKGFKEHFPEQAEVLVQSLDPSYRRALQGDGMSASSSNNNLASSAFKAPRSNGRAISLSATDPKRGFRSNSAIDLQAAQRAKTRAQYSQMARNKIASGTASLPRPRKASDAIATASPERISRTRSRNSQSQPTSRSGSPSSRLAYLYQRPDHDSPKPRRLSSGIPRSTQGSRDTSRETSPNRGASMSRYRRGSDRPPISPASRQPVMSQKILQKSIEAENALANVLNDSSPFCTPRKSFKMENHSDESETSSICSERSYNSFNQPSESYSWSGSQSRLASRELWEPCRDINEIIGLCASTTWKERKEGLLSLQYYLSNDTRLTPGELKYLTEIFTKMFMDSHTKALSVFLDTVVEVIKMHKQELEFWLYVLLQRVFMKIGTETLNSVQNKLMTALDVIRTSFPTPLLMTNVYKFLVDTTQTPNSKVKVVVLTFLTTICQYADGSQFVSTSTVASQALQRVILHVQDSKSVEIRTAAKQCLLAMWNCNTAMMTILLGSLPKDQQDIALYVVNVHMRKSSTGSEPDSPLAGNSSKALSPGASPHRDVFDQEEIYRNLRKTTAEIQNYSFETLGSKLDRDKDTTSRDSGISQMSVGNDVRNDLVNIEEKLEDLHLRNNFAGLKAPRSLPYSSGVNGLSETDSNGFRSLGNANDTDIVSKILEHCLVDVPTPPEDKIRMLGQLIDITKQGNIEPIVNNFKKLLRVLIDNLELKDPETQIIVLKILATIFQVEDLRPCWIQFVELLTLRVCRTHSDEKREVAREAETTAASMGVFPFDIVVNSLAPLIQTKPFPENLGAIKMLTKIIETNPENVTDDHLAIIMPGLIQSTDHQESYVRKSSIFCMVAIHKAIGEERLKFYINQLSGSKVKLLKLYIGRSQPTTSVPTSPKNSATS